METTKHIIRAFIKARRKAIAPGDSAAWSAAVMDKIAALDAFRRAKTVLAYWPLPGEVDTTSLVTSGQKRFILPVVDGDDLILKQYDPARMAPGAFGILEPTADAVTVQPEEIDFAIIPGVAFDPEGGRLGRGRGFYDRLLPALRCPKAGVAFPFQMIDRIPTDPWDIPMDIVVTP